MFYVETEKNHCLKQNKRKQFFHKVEMYTAISLLDTIYTRMHRKTKHSTLAFLRIKNQKPNEKRYIPLPM